MSSFKLIILLHLMMGLLSISDVSDVPDLSPNFPVPKTIIYVDESGSGNYSLAQDTIDSVLENNNQWIQILIKQGTYQRGRFLNVKQYIFFQGDSQDTTTIEYGDYESAIESATFQLHGDNFIVSDIAFKVKMSSITSLSQQPQCRDTDRRRFSPYMGPAAVLAGDKASFYRCGLHGIQDTLGDVQGRHYFMSCYISEAVDFIWGGGQSVYKTIASTIGQHGYITAQGREEANNSSAFVFMHGRVKGEVHTYLGRAYRQYSTVIFYDKDMTAVFVAKGWSAWNFKGQGASKSGRVPLLKNLPSLEVQYFLSNNFINQNGWLKKRPSYIMKSRQSVIDKLSD
ncbi:hypothetical protein BT93_A0983 [Corymbia citriodora subsp. variegata]|nr:hypothetical protein BT93_A0983 [Corymbia citriodora subsp. variegata]